MVNAQNHHSTLYFTFCFILTMIITLLIPAESQPSYQLLISASTTMASTRADYTLQVFQEDDLTITAATSIQIVLPA